MGEAHGVAAQVGQRSPAELSRQPDVPGPVQDEVKGALDLAHRADGPVPEPLEQPPLLGAERKDKRLPEQTQSRRPSSTAAVSAASTQSGFSHSTALPARSARWVHAAWRALGRAT